MFIEYNSKQEAIRNTPIEFFRDGEISVFIEDFIYDAHLLDINIEPDIKLWCRRVQKIMIHYNKHAICWQTSEGFYI